MWALTPLTNNHLDDNYGLWLTAGGRGEEGSVGECGIIILRKAGMEGLTEDKIAKP